MASRPTASNGGGLGSSHRRFKGCMENIRAVAYKRGSDEFIALELYLASRGAGLFSRDASRPQLTRIDVVFFGGGFIQSLPPFSFKISKFRSRINDFKDVTSCNGPPLPVHLPRDSLGGMKRAAAQQKNHPG